jgi:predicted HicB family RNase H-like nuclease
MHDTKFQLRLPLELHSAVSNAATRADTSVSRWVRAALKEKLLREPAGKKPRGKKRTDNA